MLYPFMLSDLPCQVGKRGGDLWEVLHKPTMVPCQAQETPHVRRVLRVGHFVMASIFWRSTDTPSL